MIPKIPMTSIRVLKIIKSSKSIFYSLMSTKLLIYYSRCCHGSCFWCSCWCGCPLITLSHTLFYHNVEIYTVYKQRHGHDYDCINRFVWVMVAPQQQVLKTIRIFSHLRKATKEFPIYTFAADVQVTNVYMCMNICGVWWQWRRRTNARRKIKIEQ